MNARWADANEAFGRGDDDAALRALDALLEKEPHHSQALNFAGWLRTRHGTGEQRTAFELGLRQLHQALAQGDADPRIPVNLGDALARDGRGHEALPPLRAWLTNHPKSALVWNSVGWLAGVVGHDDAAALEALQKATTLDRDLSAAHLNLAKVHLKAQRLERGVFALAASLHARAPFRPHEAWLLLGEVHRVRGHLRRALGAYRRAYELDGHGELRPQLQPLIAGVGGALVHGGRYFLNAVEDSLRSQAWQSRRGGSHELPVTVGALARRAEAARFRLPPAARGALEAIGRACAAAVLLPDLADRSLALELEQHGAEPELVHDWRLTQTALYEDLLVLEEPTPERFDARQNSLEAAAARRDWSGAAAALSAMESERDPDPELILGCAEGLGDSAWRLGASAEAKAAWARALSGARMFASWSSSGGEGLSRMVAVERLLAKLAVPAAAS